MNGESAKQITLVSIDGQLKINNGIGQC